MPHFCKCGVTVLPRSVILDSEKNCVCSVALPVTVVALVPNPRVVAPVAWIVPATDLLLGAVAVTPPLNVVVVVEIVSVPVLANVVSPAIVFVAPVSDTLYALAVPVELIPVLAVTLFWNATVA